MGLEVPAAVRKFPPLRGHIRLVGFDKVANDELVRELGGGCHFRSVELKDSSGRLGQHMLNKCVDVIENLTIFPLESNHEGLHELKFAKLTVLRRLTLRILLSRFSVLGSLVPSILDINSPHFKELVFEIGELPTLLYGEPSGFLGDFWGQVDGFLDHRFAKGNRDFKLILRTSEDHHQKIFRRHVREAFPLLANRGCIRFEISPLLEKTLELTSPVVLR